MPDRTTRRELAGMLPADQRTLRGVRPNVRTWSPRNYVTIRNNALWDVAGFVSASEGQSTIKGSGSTIEGNGLSGLFGDTKVSVLRSTIQNNGTFNGGAGVAANRGRVVVSQSTIQGNRGKRLQAGLTVADRRVRRAAI